MRNLKKILAVVLALVMSLSLMATASAADFKDAADISEDYQTAIEVLSRLKVFKGYAEDNTFRPQGDITRAEVAAIIYRIATGDAEDKQKDIYTDMTTSFADLNQAQWARGYVNYCHNAQIIKGESATKFNPNGKISGYATLAMILRAMGYGKNGEFEGKGWEYQTAAKAKEIGLIDNVIEAQLGSAASREMVAEILFRAMLGEMVNYTALNGYVGTGKTLGKEKFGLEEVTGVVMANEWANLNDDGKNGWVDDEVLANGKTQLLLADGTTRVLDISSSLEVAGLTCTAFMADQDKNGVLEVLTDELKADPVNVVADNLGKAIGTGAANQDKSSITALAASEGITINSDTESYWDYDKCTFSTSDILVRYAVDKDSAASWVASYAAEIDDNGWAGHSVIDRPVTVNGKTYDSWVVSITPGARINQYDWRIMRDIFYTADRIAYITDANLALNDYLIGEVYVGTASTVDVSDTLSWNQFVEKYLITDNNDNLGFVYNGQSLRVVDNNGDGKAEYVLGVGFTQDKVINVRNDVPEFYSLTELSKGGYSIEWVDGVEAYTVGTVINYSLIDNKLTVWKAPVVTDSIKTSSFQKITVTTSESGETYGQSGITNATPLSDRILSMDTAVQYNMYLDQYGFIRTYELAQGNQYALLTEMYGGTVQNSNYVSNATAVAEMTVGDETKEYTVNNAAGSVFLSREGTNAAPTGKAVAWTMGTGLATYRYNWLQPAIAHLMGQGQSPVNYGNVTGTSYNIWGRQVYTPVLVTKGSVINTAAVFDYGKEAWDNAGTPAEVEHSYSLTNVAAYALKDDNTVDLKTASTYSYDKNGNQWYYVLTTRNDEVNPNANMDKVTSLTWSDTKYGKTFAQAQADGDLAPVYAIDYVQLTKDGVTANQRHFNIAEEYNIKYNNNSNGYVNATVDTEFYIVTPNTIKHVTGYAGLPTILGKNIRAAYAVASNTAADSDGADYWVADVIVIETNAIEQDYDSISLFYWNPSETQGQVRYYDTLNNEWKDYGSNDLAKMQVIPNGTSWGYNSAALSGGYGFYELYNTNFNADGNSLTAGVPAKINKGEYNAHGIFAGVLRRDAVIASTSKYVSVNLLGDPDDTTSANISYVDIDSPNNAYSTPIYHVQYAYGTTQTVANEIRLVPAEWTHVQPGDALIWIKDSDGNTAFVVDLTWHGDETVTPDWVWDVYRAIIEEQTPGDPEGYTVTVKSSGLPTEQTWTYTVPVGGSSVTIPLNDPIFVKTNYYISNVAVTKGSGTMGSTTGTYLSPVTSATVSSVTGDVEVTVTYTLNPHDVKTIAGWTSASSTPAVDGISVNGTTILTSPGTTAKSVDTTKTATLTIHLDGTLTANQSVSVTVKDNAGTKTIESGTATKDLVTDSTGKTYTYSFTMPDEDVRVDVQVVGNVYDIKIVGEATSAGSKLVASNWSAGTQTVALTATKGYEITKVTVTDTDTGATVAIDPTSTDFVTTPATTGNVVLLQNTNRNVTITVETSPKAVTVDYSTTGYNGQIWYNKNSTATDGLTSIANSTGLLTGDYILTDTLYIIVEKGNNDINPPKFTFAVRSGDASYQAPVLGTPIWLDASGNRVENEGAATLVAYPITGITGRTTITIADF
ncbi:MAG: hypothetical protein HDT20_00305 [Oscillibacter sp.]|nr:hypothetical protein [Oscillibacter sp.]